MSKARERPYLADVSAEALEEGAGANDSSRRMEFVDAPEFLGGLAPERDLGLFVSMSAESPRSEVVTVLPGEGSVVSSWGVVFGKVGTFDCFKED